MCCLKLSYQQNAKGIVALRELEMKPSSPHLDWLAIGAICRIPEVMRSAWSPPKCTLSPSTPNIVKFSQLHSIRRRCVDTSRNRELGLYPLIEQVLLEVIATYEHSCREILCPPPARDECFRAEFHDRYLSRPHESQCTFLSLYIQHLVSTPYIYTPSSIYSSWVTLLRSS